MIQLEDLHSIRHLLGDDTRLLGTGRNRHDDVIVLIDTGRHREGFAVIPAGYKEQE